MPNNYYSKEFFKKRIEEADPEDLKKYFESGLNTMPMDLDKVPFQSDLNDLLQNEMFFKGYNNLFIAHEDMYGSYDEILVLTNELLNRLNNTILIEIK